MADTIGVPASRHTNRRSTTIEKHSATEIELKLLWHGNNAKHNCGWFRPVEAAANSDVQFLIKLSPWQLKEQQDPQDKLTEKLTERQNI
ncbi:hypothetical protein M5D96_008475 [Drosophila gunungcola]|uniref:Uncharacterized protein n=1 Tax=Drosophila gunungcola TaxID=103775 RepID=A0A9P9YKC6_9MUSC|nr:hypothetical protein M5D96_008475 [Drosophila gunungcola]